MLCTMSGSLAVREGHQASAPTTGTYRKVHPLAGFQDPLCELAARARVVDVREAETLDPERARGALQPAASNLVADARGLVADILEACDAAEPDPERADTSLSFERALDQVVEGGGASVAAVQDVAFLVQLELRQRAERVAQLGLGSTSLAVIGECESAVRRVTKGLGAIDQALSRAVGVPPRLDFASELQSSLMVRVAYAKFRTRMLVLGQPAADLHARLRAAGTQIAILVGREAYPLLRVRDRLQLRDLQHRILAWLRLEERDDVEGERVWQDVATFVDMLTQVNRRQELVEHDARLVAELVRALADVEGPLGSGLAGRLRPLRGLDDELDSLLASREDLRAGALRPMLAAISERLGATAPQ